MLENTDLQEREPYRQLAASIPFPLLVIGPDDDIVFANPAGEQFFGTSRDRARPPSLLRSFGGLLHSPAEASLAKAGLERIAEGDKSAGGPLIKSGAAVPKVDSPLLHLIAQARRRGAAVEACDVAIETHRGERHIADVSAAPYGGIAGAVVVTVHEREFAGRMNRQHGFCERLKSLGGIAAVLAHEIKNPLAGIRGAAQLLEENVGERERTLAELIRTESDRIRTLIDSMESFGDARACKFSAVNIHEVLDRARAIAKVGFARHAKFRDAFDPSLPLVSGDRDRLIQVFTNLLRNASDALPDSRGEIVLATAYRAGVYLGRDGTRRAVPLEVTVRDNGSGIAPDLLPHIFDPFVTTKPRGAGLGLALVAKIVGEHGGMVECDSVPSRTEFRVLLPVCT